jgi:hypothetical protein
MEIKDLKLRLIEIVLSLNKTKKVEDIIKDVNILYNFILQ